MITKSGFKILLVFNILLLFLLLFILFQNQLFRIHQVQHIPDNLRQEIVNLAAIALKSNDVPVGALVVYDDTIIGRGFNTVIQDGNIAGHAEVNAINDAIHKMGYEAFMDLDKSHLTIYSTYEPCEMCKGTMVHYRIKHALFMKDKSFFRWLKNDIATLIYELGKRQTGIETVQDSLFMLHPDYPGTE